MRKINDLLTKSEQRNVRKWRYRAIRQQFDLFGLGLPWEPGHQQDIAGQDHQKTSTGADLNVLDWYLKIPRPAMQSAKYSSVGIIVNYIEKYGSIAWVKDANVVQDCKR